MLTPKLCIIGAGSTEFTTRIVTDLFLIDEFKTIEISLMDIDPQRLKISEIVLKSIAKKLNKKVIISAHLNRKDALKNANFVLTSIQVGGYKPSTIIDFEIPKKYGLHQTIADTLGIGGIMRALRTIPVLEEICNDIDNVCPNAIWMQYVNPMAMNMIAINKIAPHLKSIGLCHSVQGTAEMLANDLGENIDNIVYDCAGINHMAFYTKFEKKSQNGKKENLYPKLKLIAEKIVRGELSSSRSLNPEIHGRALSEKVRYEILKRLGYFVTESSEHFAEYVPWFIKQNRSDLIEKFNIPLDEYIERCKASTKQWNNLEKSINTKTNIETALNGTNIHLENLKKSNEYASDIVLATMKNNPNKVYGNVSNKNYLIPNLPDDCCVEVPCIIDKNGIHPEKVKPLPLHLVSLIQTNISVQQLTVDAILNKKRESVYHAAMLDPLTSSQLSTDEIWQLVDEMLEAHGSYIPKLN